MGRQSEKTAKRSTKPLGRATKKGGKAVAKSARAGDKKAAKSARNPVGKTLATKTTATKTPANKTMAIKSASTKSNLTKPILAPSVAPIAVPKAAQKMMRTASPPVQPVAAHEIVLKSHKYQVGEMVYYTSPTFGRAAATGSYTVIKLLPSEGDDYQYRIKSNGEAFERVAKESQLDKM
jgi:hypothetical protein